MEIFNTNKFVSIIYIIIIILGWIVINNVRNSPSPIPTPFFLPITFVHWKVPPMYRSKENCFGQKHDVVRQGRDRSQTAWMIKNYYSNNTKLKNK